MGPDGFYVPDDIVSPYKLYEQARTDVNAESAISVEQGIGNQFVAEATPVNPVVIAKAPPGGTASTTTTTTSTATGPANPPILGSDGKPRAGLDTSTLATPAPIITGLPTPTPPFDLLSATPKPTKTVAQALREAQDNTIRQKIYSQMSQPSSLAGEYEIIFAVVQVSCNPGWRTKEHYIGDCSASVEFYDMYRKRALSRAAERQPTVFSVLPLIDAQTVEMSNSRRDITQLAFQLAGSLPAKGVDIKAKDIFQFVRQFSRDMRSVAPIPVVNSYSLGSTFGFRCSPSFLALRDPAEKHAKAANVLLPTTFPALITVVVRNVDLAAASREFRRERGETSSESGQPYCSGLGLLTHVSTRWYLKDHPPLWQLPKRLFTPMQRDTAAMEVGATQDVAIVYAAKHEFKEDIQGDATGFNPAYQELRREIIDLESKGLGRSWPIQITQHFFQHGHEQEADANRKRLNDNERLRDENARLKLELENAQKKSSQLNSPLAPDTAIALAPAETRPADAWFEKTLPLLSTAGDDSPLSVEPPLPTREETRAIATKTPVRAAAVTPRPAAKPAPTPRKVLLARDGKH